MIEPRRVVDDPKPPIIATFGYNQSTFYYEHRDHGWIGPLDWLDAGYFICTRPAHTRVFTQSTPKAMLTALNAKLVERLRVNGTYAYLYHGRTRFSFKRAMGTEEEFMCGVMGAYDFLMKYGVNLSGNSTTIKKIMGLFLDDPIIPRCSRQAAVGHRGGRNYLYHHGLYSNVEHWDINSAYPDAFTSHPWPTKFSRDPVLNIDLSGDGIAVAQIYVNEFDEYGFTTGPILNHIHPVRLSWESRSGVATLTAPFNELRMVRDYGGRVNVLQTYTGTDYVSSVFLGRFREFCETVREIDDPITRKLLKGIINSCWSVFAFKWNHQKRYRHTDFAGNKKQLVSERAKPLRSSAAYGLPISTIIAGRVRERLFREALYPITAPLMAKTDSVFSWAATPQMQLASRPNGPIGNGVGEWSLRQRIYELALSGSPSEYFYKVHAGDDWNQVTSGMPQLGDKPKMVRRMLRQARSGIYSTIVNSEPKASKTARNASEWEDHWLMEYQQI